MSSFPISRLTTHERAAGAMIETRSRVGTSQDWSPPNEVDPASLSRKLGVVWSSMGGPWFASRRSLCRWLAPSLQNQEGVWRLVV